LLVHLEGLVDEEHPRRRNIDHLLEMIADGNKIFIVDGKDRCGVGNGHDECSWLENAPVIGAFGVPSEYELVVLHLTTTNVPLPDR
jgi:hypothetical protein